MKKTYTAVFFETTEERSPVEDFLGDLDTRIEAKATSLIALLEEKGPDLHRPYADVVRGKIRELRVNALGVQVRILYAFAGEEIVLLHGIKKKKSAIPPRDIDTADARLLDWLHREK